MANIMSGDITTCRQCGGKNRLGSPPAGQIPRCGRCQKPLPWVVSSCEAEFASAVDAPTPVLVDLWAPWCGPCRTLSPILESLAADHAGALKVVKVNIDQNPVLQQRFRAQSIPMLVLMQGGEQADVSVGMRSKSDLEQWIRPFLKA